MAKRKNKARKTVAFILVAVIVIVFLFTCDLKALSRGDIQGAFAPWQDFLQGNTSSEDGEGIETGEMSIHFPMLGNQYTGDCTLIDIGNTEILIDAGSRKNSAETLKNYIDKYCEDKVLEYVIATHADQDHIAGFVGNSSGNTRTGIFYQYSVTNLIQFPLTGKSAYTDKGNKTVYGEYLDGVEYLKQNGTSVYTALECWKETNGGKRSYTLSDGITMNILYQQYYETQTNDENEYSVCMLLKEGKNNYLFTGDLEKNGEKSLVASNTLPKCKLFKGGHHGSPTSNTLDLLEVIQPEIVCVCCCCGSTEYTTNMDNVFPSQAFVDRIARYTSKIYVTSIISSDGKSGLPMNGNIVVSSNNGAVSINCSNNTIVFKETDWFKQYRIWPKGGK